MKNSVIYTALAALSSIVVNGQNASPTVNLGYAQYRGTVNQSLG